MTPVFGAEHVMNYDTGEVTAFGIGGVQASGLIGASGSLTASFTFGSLGAHNANYSGPFGGVNIGPVSVASSGGVTTIGGNLTGSWNALGAGSLVSGSLLDYSHPLQLGSAFNDPTFNLGDLALMMARTRCH